MLLKSEQIRKVATSAARFVVVLITPPEGWTPTRWDDFPSSGEIVDVVVKRQTREEAESTVYAWNWRHIANPAEWMVMMPATDEPRIGETCEMELPLFRLA